MYGAGAYKPLHHPEPRRRDRRAGARSELRNAALLEEGASPGPSPPPTHRTQRAVARLRQRYAGGPPAWVGTLLALGVAALVAGGLYHTMETADPLPFAEHRDAYERLRDLSAEVCGAEPCSLATGISPSPHADEGKRLMTRLRVRSVFHDPVVGVTTFGGESERIEYQWPATPQIAAARADRATGVDAWGAELPEAADLGGGWWRVPGR